jgi:hypothetical protein
VPFQNSASVTVTLALLKLPPTSSHIAEALGQDTALRSLLFDPLGTETEWMAKSGR